MIFWIGITHLLRPANRVEFLEDIMIGSKFKIEKSDVVFFVLSAVLAGGSACMVWRDWLASLLH